MSFNESSGRVQLAFLQIAFAVALVMGSAASGISQDLATTIYIVRHAEKLDNTSDPPLADKGLERAKELAHVLQNAGLTAIFVSKRLRTQQTAEPTADATNIDAKQLDSWQAIVTDILAKHIGGHVLVVGHSDTVDDIATGLGAKGVPELGQSQYDRLFILHRLGNEAHAHVLKYGVFTD
jgi:phosphohistidine phosphatase SixA